MARWILIVGLVAGIAVPGPAPAAAQTSSKIEKFWGYAEFVKGDTLIVDGQRLVATSGTKLKGSRFPTLWGFPWATK